MYFSVSIQNWQVLAENMLYKKVNNSVTVSIFYKFWKRFFPGNVPNLSEALLKPIRY